MLQEEKYFNGAVQDSDNAIEYTQPNAIIGGLNVRIQTQEGNKQGLVVTLEGNREIARTLPTGTNTVLRSKYFPEVGKAYIFTKNSSGLHRIEEFDVQAETFVTIFEDLTNSGSKQLLDWTGVEYIKDVVIVQDRLLYWVEFPTDTARRIDVNRNYGVVTEDDLYLSVVPPFEPITFIYETDRNYTYNNLTKNLFQFRYRYVYENHEKSPWSVYSERSIPEGEPNIDVEVNSQNNNALILQVPLPSRAYIGVEIAFRIGDGDWATIKDVSADYIESLPAYIYPFPQPPPPTPPIPTVIQQEGTIPGATDSYVFVFYNDGLYVTDDQLEHSLLADWVPVKTRALGSVNNNTILLGNNVNGLPEVNYSPEQASASLSVVSPPTIPGTFKVSSFSSSYSGNPIVMTHVIDYEGIPADGDVMIVVWTLPTTYPSAAVQYQVPVTVAEDGDREAAVNLLAGGLSYYAAHSISVVDFGSYTRLTFSTTQQAPFQPYPIAKGANVNNVAVTPVNTAVGSFKTGSSYQVSVLWYDSYHRPFKTYTNPNMVVKIPTFAELEGGMPLIGWQIPSIAPVGAAYYRIGVSRNKTHQNYWYTTANRDGMSSGGGTVTYSFDITALMRQMGSERLPIDPYEYVVGDMVNIIGVVDVDGHVTDWFNDPIRNYMIQGFFMDTSDPDDTRYRFTIRVDTTIADFTEGTQFLVEIYRKKSVLSTDDEIYYELPHTYEVSGGLNTVTSGQITKGDTYRRVKRVWRNVDDNYGPIPEENSHFSDRYISNYYSLGRPRTLFDTPSEGHFKAEIRHSREWITGSMVNNIVRFYPEDVYDSREPMYGAVENYGGIQYLQDRENRLICVQELKVGYIPVNRSIIEDTLEQQQIGISSKLLNPISYYAGPNIGIGNDYAIPSYEYVNGAAYFIDPHEMLPVRAGLDGTRYIQITYSGEMKRKIREMVTLGNYIFSVWDDRMNEWLVVFNDYTYVYDEKSNGWIPKRSYLPSSGFTANDRLYTTNGNGQLYIHDDESNRNRFYGVDYPAELKFPITSPRVKTYQSIALHMDDEVETVEDGIETQLGHVSDLVVDDFTWREGIRYANFLRDKNSGTDITNGDRLKGRWVTLHLVQEAPVGEWNLIKAVVKSSISTNNE